MNRRGVVFLLGLVVFVILSVLAAAFFTRTMSENNQVRRQVSSTQAFWHAEEGLAQATTNLPTTTSLGCASCNYSTITTSVPGSPGLYNITSVGRVFLGTASITRTLEVYVALNQSQFGEFNNAIEVGGNLTLSGSYDIEPEPEGNYTAPNSNFTFSEKFGVSYDEVKYAAISGEPGFVYYDQDTLPKPVTVNNEVVVIEVNSTTTKKIQFPNSPLGDGVVIVNVINGDVDIEGGNFTGIFWAIGELKITGNPDMKGTVLSEVDLTVDTKVGGDAYLEWNQTAIDSALLLMGSLAPRAYKSWRELP
jgi:type II secretory pathway pseudopilin PulG